MRNLLTYFRLDTILLLSFICSSCQFIYSQPTNNFPEVGKVCPTFHLSNIQYYSKTTSSLQDFAGKWLVLDFWSEYCGSCIASLPKVNALQKQFNDRITFMMIGIPGDNRQTIMNLYKKVQSKYSLELPVAYDSNLAARFNLKRLPYIIVIDPKGVVKAITSSLTAESISNILAGRKVILRSAYRESEKMSDSAYDSNTPILINNNGGKQTDYLYRSVLTKWTNKMPINGLIYQKSRLEVFCVDLKTLYRVAFTGKMNWTESDTSLYGKFYSDPILEVKDSSLFMSDDTRTKNRFCYSQSIPDEKDFLNPSRMSSGLTENTRVLANMQNDLKNYFGFDATIETRKMPFYELRIVDSSYLKLKTDGKTSGIDEPNGYKQGFRLENVPFKNVIPLLFVSMNAPRKIPIVDKTNISFNIDLQLDGIYFDDRVKELRKHGISLFLSECVMKVIVIRNAEY